jgi:hypothetical protein
VKRLTIVILTAVYLLSAIGVSASSFYCCGVRMSTTFSLGDVHTSNSKAKAHNCCKTTKQSFKVKDSHYSTDSFLLLVKFFPVLHQQVTAISFDAQLRTVAYAFQSHAPPFRQHQPIYSLNCTYRI